MERRGSGIAVSVRGDIFGCLSCCTYPQLKALAAPCWSLVEDPLHFRVFLHPVGPTAVEGGRCSIGQNSRLVSDLLSNFSAA